MPSSTNQSSSFSKRLDQMSNGLEELENWLQDTLRQGLASLEQQPDFWKDISARMVDAKLGAVGRRLKTIRLLIGQQENWYEQVTQEIGNIYLLLSALKNIDQLAPPLQRDVLTMSGVTVRKNELEKDGMPVTDIWMILATSQKEEDNLRSRRTWVYGWKTKRYGLVLDFAWGRTDFTEFYTAGEVFEGTIIYYPSNAPIRVQVKGKKIIKDRTIKRIVGFAHLDAFLENYAIALAANPWLLEFPCAIQDIVPVMEGDQMLLVDTNKHLLPSKMGTFKQMKILALSGGHPINLFGEWFGKTFYPLSVSVDERFVIL